MLAREYERIRSGKPPVMIDFNARYEFDVPIANKRNDDTAWKQSLQRNQRSLRQKMIEYEAFISLDY